MADPTGSITEMLNAFMAAVESLELKRIEPFFEENAQMFSPLGAHPARLNGRGEIMEQFKSIADVARAMPTPLKIEPHDLIVREFGDVAVVTFHLTNLPGPLHRRSFILHRGSGGWRIAHIHASTASTAL